MTVKYRVMKFNGDDCYSYAVFRSADVRHLRSPVTTGFAKPLVTGCSKAEAESYKRTFERDSR